MPYGNFFTEMKENTTSKTVQSILFFVIFAVFLIVEGISLIGGALRLRKHAGWSWTLINGIAALILGIMVYSRWPSDSAWVLGLFFGINLLFSGMSLLMLGLAAPKSAGA